VRLFLSHVCEDHALVGDIRGAIRQANNVGSHPLIELVFGCPELSGAAGGRSVTKTWQEGLASSDGVLFIWTKDAPLSEGTAKEWKHNRDVTDRPYCFALENGAVLPKDADPDRIRFGLPVEWRSPVIIQSIFRPAPPLVKHLPILGKARQRFIGDVWKFAKSLLVPLV
jgi:hypothetical protein